MAGTIRVSPVPAVASIEPDFVPENSDQVVQVAPIEPDFVPENSDQVVQVASGRPRRATRVPRRYC